MEPREIKERAPRRAAGSPGAALRVEVRFRRDGPALEDLLCRLLAADPRF